MHEEKEINPQHMEIRSLLRIAGPLAAGAGLCLVAIGIGSFFAAFGSDGPPRYFWCAFLGMPILFIGVSMCMFGFMGAVARYQAGEVAPVGRDTFNYLAEGTKDGVQTMATAVAAGLGQGLAGTRKTIACPQCGHLSDAAARFCDECGMSLAKACAACGQTNDGDAKFCANCGGGLTT
jgi:RNA polymerase subunit RPABC4/transcription elongation factor Spt4